MLESSSFTMEPKEKQGWQYIPLEESGILYKEKVKIGPLKGAEALIPLTVIKGLSCTYYVLKLEVEMDNIQAIERLVMEGFICLSPSIIEDTSNEMTLLSITDLLRRIISLKNLRLKKAEIVYKIEATTHLLELDSSFSSVGTKILEKRSDLVESFEFDSINKKVISDIKKNLPLHLYLDSYSSQEKEYLLKPRMVVVPEL
jgi:hypothetical protein